MARRLGREVRGSVFTYEGGNLGLKMIETGKVEEAHWPVTDWQY
jgi:hypothetical protein